MKNKDRRPYNDTETSDLVAIIQGELDPIDHAAFELNARCRDLSGNWVGPKKSTVIYLAFVRERKPA